MVRHLSMAKLQAPLLQYKSLANTMSNAQRFMPTLTHSSLASTMSNAQRYFLATLFISR